MTTENAGIRDEEAGWPVIERVSRFQGGVISVRTDSVRMADGTIAKRDVVEHPGSVGVIALDEADRVLLIRQYRHPPGRMLWEPPAGIRDHDDEPLLETAHRELYEEAGYRAREWHTLIDAFTSPGMSDERMRVFLARDLTPVPEEERFVGQHEEACLPQTWVPLDAAVSKILAGEIHNPTAVMGILAAYAARTRSFRDIRTSHVSEG